MSKKKREKRVGVKQIVAGTLATTFLLESCVKDYGVYYVNQSVPDINKQYKNLDYECLSIPISAEVKNYLDFVNYLLVDILIDPTSATRFLANPNVYVEEAGFEPIYFNMTEGYDGMVQLNDGLVQLIVTLADTEIRQAALNNDIAEFLRLCKEKNVFKSIAPGGGGGGPIIDNPLLGLSEELQAILNAMFDDGIGNSCFALVGAVVTAVFVVVVVSLLGVVASTVAINSTKVKVYFESNTSGKSNIFIDSSHEFILQLWGFYGGNPDQTYVLLSEYEEQQINSVIEALQQHFPEKLEGVNIDNLKQFIALNIQKNLE